jgi:hypothetical protein
MHGSTLISSQIGPSQIGLKMKVKLATYFKLNKKLCIDMNYYFFMDEIN